jgi:alpha-beta hydrolase superfamily lysophospholipase
MEFNVELKNGQVLKGIIRTPGENPSGIIVLVHGIGEHTGRYTDWAGLFRKQNFAFAGLDLPGHGRSEGRRGKIKSYSVLHEMIEILLRTASRTFPGTPVYIYGHSLGGGIVLDHLIRFKPAIKGAIVTSPWLKLSFEPAKSKLALAALMSKLSPGLVQSSGLNTIYLSHDQTVVDAYKNDPLVHDKISVGLFTGAMKSAEYCLNNASKLKIPTLIIHGSNDMICSPEGSREFCSKTSKAELKIWEGGYHELHNEPFRLEVFDYIMHWIRDHAKTLTR